MKNLIWKWAAALAALSLAACPTELPTCGPDELLSDGLCVVADANCDTGAPGSLAPRCSSEHRHCFADALGAVCGLCLDGYTEEDGACRAVRTCAELDCEASQRSCLPPGRNADATCGGCVEGAQLQADGSCVAPGCNPDVAGSVAAGCRTQRRACLMQEGSPSCGGCWSGFVDDLGACRAVRTCQDLGCGAANRLCNPQGEHQDASCGACRGGYTASNGACVVLANASCSSSSPNTILAACQAEHRTCVAGAPDQCGACETGYTEDATTRTCVPQQGCAQLDCAAQHRDCSETPFGHCTGCVSGFTQDAQTGQCRPVKTCAQLSCASGAECIPETATADAVCRTTCGAGEVWNGASCQTCPACDGEGEAGVWSTTTVDGYCTCQTQAGYFYSVGGDVGTFPCDADGDGWVRESARAAINSNDPALRANARCSLRTIDAFELVNERGQTRTVSLTPPLPLYETDRDDDDSILRAVLRQRGIPAYGARDISAAELNRLTKLCYFAGADYNDNGIADTDEHANSPLPPGYRPDQADFIRFSYFAELNHGEFRASVADPLRGTWVIREKSRLTTAAAGEKVPLLYPVSDGTHWRTCDVRTDSEAATLVPAVGMDLASHTNVAGGFAGMNHHSQFKCVVMENEPNPAMPSQITVAEATARNLRLNACSNGAAAPVTAGNAAKVNPDCTLTDTAQAQPGEVYWAAIPFNDYDPYSKWPTVTDRPYVRGCVNDCAERLPSCPHWGVNPDGVSCQYEANNFGKFIQCTAFEVCDGLDNNGDGQADEGNPGGGVACANDGNEFPKGFPSSCTADAQCNIAQGYYCEGQVCRRVGECVSGVTNCVNGQVVCTSTVTPGTVAESCNGKDDNCNRAIDENDPGGGVQDCSTGLLGVCGAGKLSCQAGQLQNCVQQVQSSAETCDGLDNDCDGETDEAPVGSCPAPWAKYYKDADNDGFGDKNDVIGICSCDSGPSKTIGGVVYRKNNTDCCDSDSNSHPNANTLRSNANACGSWDWNCDGTITKTSSTSVSEGCGYRAVSCGTPSVGWANSVPDCGNNHTWYTNGCGAWAPCPQDSQQRTQQCY